MQIRTSEHLKLDLATSVLGLVNISLEARFSSHSSCCAGPTGSTVTPLELGRPKRFFGQRSSRDEVLCKVRFHFATLHDTLKHGNNMSWILLGVCPLVLQKLVLCVGFCAGGGRARLLGAADPRICLNGTMMQMLVGGCKMRLLDKAHELGTRGTLDQKTRTVSTSSHQPKRSLPELPMNQGPSHLPIYGHLRDTWRSKGACALNIFLSNTCAPLLGKKREHKHTPLVQFSCGHSHPDAQGSKSFSRHRGRRETQFWCGRPRFSVRTSMT